MNMQAILNELDLKIIRYEPVRGGDINESYCLYDRDKKYFLKLNVAGRLPGMFEKEARGLAALSTALQSNDSIFIPTVLKHGSVNDQQYLLLEWIPAGQPQEGFWESFGNAIARLHKQHHPFFGWHEDNYIGTLIQKNTKHKLWHTFFAECRVMPLVQLLYNNESFSKQDVLNAEMFCRRCEQIFPIERSSMLHGDLWSGNFMITSNNKASIYDPAVYCGHRETDIGMTKLFGGFDQRFYEAYHEVYPLEPQWQQRLAFSQLYPLLVHAVLFGGHYCGRVRSILQQF
jgi:fructosamine-3-kinase